MHIREMTCATCCYNGRNGERVPKGEEVVCNGGPQMTIISKDRDILPWHPCTYRDPQEYQCSLGRWRCVTRPKNVFLRLEDGEGFGIQEEVEE